MVLMSCRKRWTGLVSPVISRPASDPAKMKAVRAWVNALTLGALTGFALINITPSRTPISELPLALIPTAAVPARPATATLSTVSS
jgi:hypothetical protein